MPTGNVLLSETDYVRINTGLNSLLLQAHRDSVRVVFSDLKPVRGNSAFHLLGGGDDSLHVPYTDVNVWVLAMSEQSSLTVTEFVKSAVTELPKTAFNELRVEAKSPVTQISAQYGLLTNVLTVVDNAASGTNTIDDGKFTCDSGTASNGLASILTLRQLAYRPGQGASSIFSALFSAGVAGNVQAAGLITAENSITFGYEQTEFGIVHSHDGRDELQELTLTSSGTGTATVTVDDVSYNVTISGTIEDNAFQIATSLKTQVPNYNFTSNSDQVIAQSVLPTLTGSFAYGGPGAGSWVQLVAGVGSTRDFTAQSDWNRNVMVGLDPLKGNVYEIQFQCSFGVVNFYIIDTDTGLPILVHSIEYPNNHFPPLVTNPTFRIGWISVNVGTTINVRVQGATAAAFISGSIFRDTPEESHTGDQTSVGSNLTHIMSVRNRVTFGNKVNRAELYPLLLTAASQTNKAAFFKIIKNPVYADPVVFEYKNKESSIAEVATDNVLITGGEELGSITVTNGSAVIVKYNDSPTTTTSICPGDTFCIAAVMSSGAASDCQASLTFQGDL